MNSTTLMQILILVYIIIMIVSLVEKNWPRALYWGSAALLSVAVLAMQK
jgi:hypothetical protein